MIHCLCKELWPLENSKEIWPYAAPSITSQITGNLIVHTIYHLLMFRNVFSSQQYIILIKIGVRIKSHFLEIFNFIHCQLSLLTPTWHQAAMFLWAWSNLWCHPSVAYRVSKCSVITYYITWPRPQQNGCLLSIWKIDSI